MADLSTYREPDFEQMKRLEGAVVAALQPFMPHTDPLLGVLALARILRTILRQAPRDSQRDMLPVLLSYIEGRTQLPEDDRAAGRLWTPRPQ